MSALTNRVPTFRPTAFTRRSLALLGLLSALAFSSGIASAADSDFACNIPTVGSITCGGQWNTTGGIPIQLFFVDLPRYTYAKAIRCADNSDISAYAGCDPGVDRLTWKAITPAQPAGICFKLNMNGPDPAPYAVSGQVRH